MLFFGLHNKMGISLMYVDEIFTDVILLENFWTKLGKFGHSGLCQCSGLCQPFLTMIRLPPFLLYKLVDDELLGLYIVNEKWPLKVDRPDSCENINFHG